MNHCMLTFRYRTSSTLQASALHRPVRSCRVGSRVSCLPTSTTPRIPFRLAAWSVSWTFSFACYARNSRALYERSNGVSAERVFSAPLRTSIQLILDDLQNLKDKNNKLAALLKAGGGRYRSSGQDSVIFSIYTDVFFSSMVPDWRGMSSELELSCVVFTLVVCLNTDQSADRRR
jgi:hypothetical protein